MTEDPLDLLQQAVISENALAQQFVDLLGEEQSALTSGKTNELPLLIERKEKLAAELNRLTKQRGDVLTALGYSANRFGMEAWKEANPEQKTTVETWMQTLLLTTRACELNRVNGELVQMHMQYNNNALAVLLHKETHLDLYGSDGRPSMQGGRKIDDSI